MSAIATLIPVIQKAPNVCGYCRTRKQACDRTLPSCSRCASKGQPCDYTPSPPRTATTTDPLIVQSGTHAPNLSCRGTWELLQSVAATLHDDSDLSARSKLSDFVIDILDLAGSDLSYAIDEFRPSIQQWCPILCEDIFGQGPEDIAAEKPLLALGIWLVTKAAHCHAEHCFDDQLYQALKQVLALMQIRGDVNIGTLQLSLLISVFEVTHGLSKQAFQTLGFCKSMLITLTLGDNQSSHTEVLGCIEWLQASLLMLDRIFLIATSSILIPLTLPPGDPICTPMAAKYQPPIPPHSPTLFPTSPRKVHIRALVAIASGHALDYIHAVQRQLTPTESYDEVDSHISACIRMLVDKPQPHTWLHCDAIALAFCSHLLLQQAQMQYLLSLPPTIRLGEAIAKAGLALRYSRRMSWDMVKVAIGKVESAEEVTRLPFAGLCCVLRAGLAVLESATPSEDTVVTLEDADGFQRILSWFAGRWAVGKQFQARSVNMTKQWHL